MKMHLHTFIFSTIILTACSGAGVADNSNAVDAAANTPAGVAIRKVIELTGLSPEQITVLSEEAMEFGDGSLGCPQPGMAYAQVITPGQRVFIKAGNAEYDVRVAGSSAVLCDPRTSKGVQR